ncbi:MAG: adenosylcobalamin-dependent ribonucleoside-diphosphate reductase [Saprospiraceae bacterium]|nr:adenosylcobalamin-dependent ribonucleoside-diphosphate reductase [Saprospiraceae bacterium]
MDTLETTATLRHADAAERPTYSHEEALAAATEYFDGDTLAAGVWLNKYALKDSFGNIYERTPEEMHRRIAAEIARIENRYKNPMPEEEVYALLRRFRFLVPQGSPMSGIGNPFQVVSLSNCFVIGVQGSADSYGAILKMDEEQVQLMKRRGGVGHDLSHLRPGGTPVMNSALTSTGILPFMERYSNSTREVAQDGRRGALMLTLAVQHPDAPFFVDAKLDSTKVTGANISLRIDDEFMQAVRNGQPYRLRFPVGSKNPKLEREINAGELWKKIIHNAWKSAEPGVLFWDTVLRESVPDCYADLGFGTVSTNPCGEIPLCPYDSCRLLAINLLSYVRNPFTPEASFDFDLLKQHGELAQRVMDDIIDLELEKIEQILAKIDDDPEPEPVKATERELWLKIREKCLSGRRTGIGITAEGDMLAALGIRYGSDESLDFCENLHRTLALAVYRGSVNLARERGPFPMYDSLREARNPFIQRLREADPDLYADMERYGRRNIALLTIAPTGTTSLMTQTTSGLEPVFRISYKRRKKVNPNDKNARVTFTDAVGDSWEDYHVFHIPFRRWLEIRGYDLSKVDKMSDTELQQIIEQSPWYRASAEDVDWVQKVHLQGRVQKWVDHSISVTVNVPEEATEELIEKIYLTGWEAGCKGMTVYREGSRSGVLVSDKKKDEKKDDFAETAAPKRPKVLDAVVVSFMNNDERWVAVVGLYLGRPYEIFTGRAVDSFSILTQVSDGKVIKVKEDGKNRYDFQYMDKGGYKVTIEGLSRTFNKEYWNYARLISGVLRHGMPLPYVVDMVENLHLETASLNNWKNGVVRALRKFIPDGTAPSHNTCPSCKTDNLVYQEGCLHCKNCGHSECN